MWYKTAKYGTLWDRLGPESEQEIDRILDESTIREKTIDPTTNTEKEVRKIDYKKLDQLLKKSVLGEKGVLNKIIEFHDPKYGRYGGIWLANDGSIPLIQTKILNIPILIRNYMDKVIHINPNAKYSYIQTKAIIKHEISHAISSAVLPHRQDETYLQPGRLNKENVRDNYKATGIFLSFDKIRKAIFYDKLPAFEKFLSEKLGPDYIKEYFLENLEESTLPQRAEKINSLFSDFNWDVNVAGLYRKRINEVSKDELREIEKIEDDPYIATSQSSYVSPEIDKLWDKHNAELEKRSKLLGPGVDLYYANPEETRSHLAENKEYFSLNSVKDFYALQNYTTPKEQHIPEFLNLIKTIFNEAVIHGESGNFYHISNYFDALNLGDFFRSDLYYKRYDLKFQRQLAKILNENYQQIKQYFNNMLTKKEGE
jgi:hypothetical protein